MAMHADGPASDPRSAPPCAAPGPRAPLAIVTMVFDEAVLLPAWIRHYTGQVSPRHCYVIDHGSTDGSTDAGGVMAGVNIVGIPRSPQDDQRRSRFVSEFCGSLLVWYSAVIYVDVDEFLVADPGLHGSLADYAAGLAPDAVVTAIGLDVVHVAAEEAALDWRQPVSTQRSWVRFSSAMCKPLLIRRSVAWAPGFHNIDAPPRFGEILLFHLRYADLDAGLARLQRTRTQAWSTPQAGSHQRMQDAAWGDMLRGMAGLPRRPGGSLGPDDGDLQRWLSLVIESGLSRQDQLYRIDLHLSGDALWLLPERFRGRF